MKILLTGSAGFIGFHTAKTLCETDNEVIGMLPLQPGDVEHTFADSSSLMKVTGYNPNTPIEKGVEIFAKWFLNYYYS